MPLELITMLGSAGLGFITKMMANIQADKRERFLIREKAFKNTELSLKAARAFKIHRHRIGLVDLSLYVYLQCCSYSLLAYSLRQIYLWTLQNNQF